MALTLCYGSSKWREKILGVFCAEHWRGRLLCLYFILIALVWKSIVCKKKQVCNINTYIIKAAVISAPVSFSEWKMPENKGAHTHRDAHTHTHPQWSVKDKRNRLYTSHTHFWDTLGDWKHNHPVDYTLWFCHQEAKWWERCDPAWKKQPAFVCAVAYFVRCTKKKECVCAYNKQIAWVRNQVPESLSDELNCSVLPSSQVGS